MISYACEMTRDGEQVATGTLRIACVTKRPDGGMRSVEIPEDIARRFTPFGTPTSRLQPPTSASAS